MKRDKSFDCVRMKREIQKQIREECSGLSDEESCRRQMAKVARNPILGPFHEKLRKKISSRSM